MTDQFAKYHIRSWKYWDLYLHPEQCYLGRCYAALKTREAIDPFPLPIEQQQELDDITVAVRNACETLFKPDLYNYASLRNTWHVCQWHIIPRYQCDRYFAGWWFSDRNWGKNYAPYKDLPQPGCDSPEMLEIRDAMRRELQGGNMGYDYEQQKRDFLYTDEGQRIFLQMRDEIQRIWEMAGACDKPHIGNGKVHYGGNWEFLCCIDRLKELGELHEIKDHDGHRVYLPGPATNAFGRIVDEQCEHDLLERLMAALADLNLGNLDDALSAARTALHPPISSKDALAVALQRLTEVLGVISIDVLTNVLTACAKRHNKEQVDDGDEPKCHGGRIESTRFEHP